MEAVNWSEVGNIAASWVVSPAVAGTISFILFRSMQVLIFKKEDPLAQSRLIVPWYVMMAGFVISMVNLLKGLKHLGFNLTVGQAAFYSLFVSIAVMIIGYYVIGRTIDSQAGKENGIDRVFSVLMVFTACAMAFAYDSNDIANSLVQAAAIYGVVSSGGLVTSV